jgi:hypothetical protein
VLWSHNAACSAFIKQKIGLALDAWSSDRLVLAVLDDAPLPMGFADLSAISLIDRSTTNIQPLVQSIKGVIRKKKAASTPQTTVGWSRRLRWRIPLALALIFLPIIGIITWKMLSSAPEPVPAALATSALPEVASVSPLQDRTEQTARNSDQMELARLRPLSSEHILAFPPAERQDAAPPVNDIVRPPDMPTRRQILYPKLLEKMEAQLLNDLTLLRKAPKPRLLRDQLNRAKLISEKEELLKLIADEKKQYQKQSSSNIQSMQLDQARSMPFPAPTPTATPTPTPMTEATKASFEPQPGELKRAEPVAFEAKVEEPAFEDWISIAVVIFAMAIPVGGGIFVWLRRRRLGSQSEVSGVVALSGDLRQTVENTNHRVFVSYSHQDIKKVDNIVRQIEDIGCALWIDRNKPGSQRYAGPIVEAIKMSKLVALMCSRNAFASDHVIREVYVAGKFKKPFVIFELDHVDIPAELLYFLYGFPLISVSEMSSERLRTEILRFMTPEVSVYGVPT